MTLGKLAGLVVLTISAACATAPLPPAAARVRVYQAPLDGPAANPMPGGCREVARQPVAAWTELRMTGTRDPYRTELDRTAAAGGNVLLVLSRITVPRQCYDCPAASPITDCPPCEGAWFDVVLVSYACPAASLAELPPERRS